MADIDPINKFAVASAGRDDIVFLRPLPQRMSKDDALLLAAYIVTIVGDDEQFQAVRRAVEST